MWHKENHLSEIPAHVENTWIFPFLFFLMVAVAQGHILTHHPICVVHAATCESCPPASSKRKKKAAAVVGTMPLTHATTQRIHACVFFCLRPSVFFVYHQTL